MLNSLVRCDGLEDWHVFVNVEPGPDQAAFSEICQKVLPAQSFTVRINPRVLGVRGNPYDVLEHVFSNGSALNICLEEDFVVAPDILQLALWYERIQAPHLACMNFLAGACGNPGYLSDTQHPNLFFETECFNSIGLVLTQSNWQRMRAFWLGPDPGLYRVPDKTLQNQNKVAPRHLDIDGWDWSVYAQILRDPSLSVLQPVAARCVHAGTTGTYCNADYQERAFGHVDLFDGGSTPEAYQILPPAELPKAARAHVESLHHAADLMRDLYDSRYPRAPLYLRLINRVETWLWGHPLTRR